MADDMGDKTEAPSQRKLSEARDKNQVAKSADLAGAVELLGLTILLAVAGTLVFDASGKFLKRVLGEEVGPESLHPDSFEPLVRDLGAQTAIASAPFLAAAVVLGTIAHVMQHGLLLSTHPLEPNFNKMNPISGFQRMFGLKSWVKGGMSVAKLVAVSAVVGVVLMNELPAVAGLPALSLAGVFRVVGSLMLKMAAWILVALLLIGVADYAYQWWQHRRELRMSKQEVKDEHKQSEGDPHVKSRRMRVMREIAQHRARQAVPKADVVITNPTHFSVAVQYDAKTMRAPRVVAKGVDHMAMQIRAIATQHDVPILERPPLARALYYGVDVGHEVPPEQYQAVAEVLAYVYRLKNSPVAAA